MSLPKRLRFVVFLGLLLTWKVVIAQQSHTQVDIYLFQNDQLVSLAADQSTSKEVVSSLETTSVTLTTDSVDTHYLYTAQAHLSIDGNQVYLLEVLGKSIYEEPTHSRLVAWDRLKNTHDILYDERGVLKFFASSDMNSAIIFHYSGEYGNSRPMACLLIVKTRQCDVIDFGDLPVGQVAYWVSNTEVVLWAGTYDPLYILDTATGKTKNLNISELSKDWFLDAVNVVPGTRTLIAAALPRENSLSYSSSLFIIDIDQGTMQPLSYEIYKGNELQRSVDLIAMSFDHNYLLYGTDNYVELIDFKSGHSLQQFTNVTQALWVAEETLLIQTSGIENQVSLLEIDTATSSTETLATGDAALGLLLSPSNSCSMTVWSAC